MANAILLTVGILLVMLFMYTQRIIKVTQGFISFVVLCTLAIALVPLVDSILNFFGLNVPYIHGTGLLGIGISISLFVVIIAALNLLLDFHFTVFFVTKSGGLKIGFYVKYIEMR